MLSLLDLNNVEVSWRKAKIPKKTPGEFRELTIPNDALKRVQEDALYYVYALVRAGVLKVSACAHGFLPGRNCLSAIHAHSRDARCTVCCDLEDFFTNCKDEYLQAIMLDSGVAPAYVNGIIRCCAYEGGFPQGSPASPMLTNIIMFNTDNMIAAYAEKHGFRYTRYADDMQFTLEVVTPETERMLQRTKENGSHDPYVWFLYGVEKILQETLGLKIKHKKDHTIFNHSVTPQSILGITTRQDGHGYNAEKRFRMRTRAGVCNLYHKIFDQQGGVPTKEDHLKWSQIKGQVCYCNTVRRASDPEAEYSGFDPCIQQKYYQPLEAQFAAKREEKKVRRTARKSTGSRARVLRARRPRNDGQ